MTELAGSVIAIGGPTATGKTELADAVAAELGGAVVSADAMQVYRRMDIGTAKANPAWCKAPLLMVDVVEPAQEYSAALYQRDARAVVDELLVEGRPPVLCGGTGLYLKAVLDEMDFPAGEGADPVRKRYTALADELGPKGLHDLLAERDPASAALIHPNNVRRVVRAFEMLEQGRSYAEQQVGFAEPHPHYRSLQFALTRDRAELYRLIDARVDAMMAAGLLDEVRALADEGLAGTLTARQAIGYKELIDYLQGTCTLEEAVDTIKLRSRRYAKRQLTWFRRDKRITWINRDEVGLDEAVRQVTAAYRFARDEVGGHREASQVAC